MDPKAQETEFYRRRGLPEVDVRICTTDRCTDVYLSCCGREFTDEAETCLRGWVSFSDFHLS